MSRLKRRAYQQSPRDGRIQNRRLLGTDRMDPVRRTIQASERGEIGNESTAQTHNLLPGAGHRAVVYNTREDIREHNTISFSLA